MDAEAREKNIEEETKDEQQQQQQLEERPNEGGTEGVDVNKTLYDAEEFLTNFSGLRLENDQLKRNNDELQSQLAKAQQDLQQLLIDKDNLEANLQQEREEHKEELWKIRGEIQKVQEERLQWKEKYLNIYMKINDNESSSTKSRKRKSGLPSDSEEFFTNLSSTYGLTNQDEHPVPPVTNQLWDPETKRFECKECRATFRMFSELQSHVDKNKCVKYTFQCPQCSVVFSNADGFTKHLKYHMSKTIQCDFCGEKFMHEKGLQRHTKMYHTEFNQRFQCQYCSKIFNRKSLLENHIRRHFDYRPFQCNECDKSFKTKQYLTGHVNGVHKNDKQFVCGKCDARFSWRTTWKRHMQNHILKANKKKNKKRALNADVVHTDASAGASTLVHPTVVAMSLQQQPQMAASNVVQLTSSAVSQLAAAGNLTATFDHAHLTRTIPTSLVQQALTLQAVPQLAHQQDVMAQQSAVQLNQQTQNVAQLSHQTQGVAQLTHPNQDVDQLT